MTRASAVLILVAWLTLPGPAAAGEVELYRVRARTAAELAALVDPLLAPEGAAVADETGGFVLLQGPAPLLAQALRTLAELDVLPRQYRVRSELASHAVLAARGISVSGWTQVGDLRVGIAPRGTGESEAPESGGELRISAGQLRADSGRQFEASIVALEGQPAELWTGNLFPYAVRTWEGGHGRRDLRMHETAWMSVRQGLRVLVRSTGESVQLDLVPVVQDGSPETGIREVGAATRIRLRPGEQLVIGSIERDSGGSTRDLGSYGSGFERSRQVMLVHVDLLD